LSLTQKGGSEDGLIQRIVKFLNHTDSILYAKLNECIHDSSRNFNNDCVKTLLYTNKDRIFQNLAGSYVQEKYDYTKEELMEFIEELNPDNNTPNTEGSEN
jgi:hypothetical protein